MTKSICCASTKTELEFPALTLKTQKWLGTSVIPALGSKDRHILKAHLPFITPRIVSLRFSGRPCLKGITLSVREDNMAFFSGLCTDMCTHILKCIYYGHHTHRGCRGQVAGGDLNVLWCVCVGAYRDPKRVSIPLEAGVTGIKLRPSSRTTGVIIAKPSLQPTKYFPKIMGKKRSEK